jgi:hypothetical protein
MASKVTPAAPCTIQTSLSALLEFALNFKPRLVVAKVQRTLTTKLSQPSHHKLKNNLEKMKQSKEIRLKLPNAFIQP